MKKHLLISAAAYRTWAGRTNTKIQILLAVAIGLLVSLSASSQILKPLKWSYQAKKTAPGEATLFIKATLNPGWHLYSQALPKDGPLKTTFSFVPSPSFQLTGPVTEPGAITRFEKAFGSHVRYFEKEVTFQQKLKLSTPKTIVRGSVEFMVCSDQQCLPPQAAEFSIPVK